jgi:hypothetical protein
MCIIVLSQCVAFYMSCIQMHLYASTHKVHSVDTLHSPWVGLELGLVRC